MAISYRFLLWRHIIIFFDRMTTTNGHPYYHFLDWIKYTWQWQRKELYIHDILSFFRSDKVLYIHNILLFFRSDKVLDNDGRREGLDAWHLLQVCIVNSRYKKFSNPWSGMRRRVGFTTSSCQMFTSGSSPMDTFYIASGGMFRQV